MHNTTVKTEQATAINYFTDQGLTRANGHTTLCQSSEQNVSFSRAVMHSFDGLLVSEKSFRKFN